MKMSWRRLLAIVIALAALAAVFAPGVKAADRRLLAEIEEPFVINGTLYPAGPLSIRQLGDYTPSETLNEIWAGNDCLGVLLAAEIPASRRESGDSLLFERDQQGLLVLTGFVFRGQRPRNLRRLIDQPHKREVLLAIR
jgi:hypothetical protein